MKPAISQPTGLIGEFINFVTKTNAIALAIGVILGGAATKLVTSFVENILNPILGLLFNAEGLNNALMIGPIKLGAVIGSIIDFLAVMLVMFIIIKLVAKNMLEDKK